MAKKKKKRIKTLTYNAFVQIVIKLEVVHME